MILVTQILTKIFSSNVLFNRRNFSKTNFTLLINIFAICFIGFAEIYSATHKDGSDMFVKQIFLFCIASVFIFTVLPAVSLKFIIKNSYLAYFVAILLLLAIFVIGDVSMGARRWINLFGFRLQPSEIIKTFIILAVARYLHFTQIDDIGRLLTYPAVLAMIFIPAGLIILQPDLGTAIIIILIGMGMIFVSGIKYLYVSIAAILALCIMPIAWMNMHDYQKQRVQVFIDPSLDPLGSGYNITQSKIAIGSGGFSGNGYLEGKQSQLNFLPENHTDFIFTHFCEEFGFVGAITLLVLYSFLFFQILTIAISAESHFVRLATAGIMLNIFLHIFINIGMTIGLLPVVGVPLPFMSYGGTFLLSNLLNIGLLMNFSTNRLISLPTAARLLHRK